MTAVFRPSAVQVSLFVIALLSLSTIAGAEAPPKSLKEVMPVKTERTSFEYEQCFNGCQQALDKALERCSLAVDPEDEVAQSRCRQAAIDQFEQALARCPADTGRRAQR